MLFRGTIKRLTALKYSKVAPVFVLVSLFIWLTSTLSEQHTAEIPVNVIYVELDPLQYLQDFEPQKANVFCTGSGFRLMLARMFPQTLSVVARNIKQHSGVFELKAGVFAEYVEKHFDGGLVVDLKTLGAIQTPLRKAMGRKLAVRMIDSVALESGYDWISDYSFTPDSLYVSGPEAVVNTLDFAYITHDLTSPISVDFDAMCSLKSNKEGLLQWSQNQIHVQRSVARFTEYLMRVPIEVLQHQSQNTEIELIPRHTELILSTPISLVKQLKPTDFRVVCEFEDNTDTRLLGLKVLESPNQVRILRVSPNEVQFLIRE